ncbi:hypothetical protein K1W54_25190 [Micromonospora sp. CPCC 205371]|nr:hypothetical protein [Micromonospora sp. CPCC 205371]
MTDSTTTVVRLRTADDTGLVATTYAQQHLLRSLATDRANVAGVGRVLAQTPCPHRFCLSVLADGSRASPRCRCGAPRASTWSAT